MPPLAKFSIVTREFISEKHYVRQSILANKYSRIIFSFDSGFNFTFDLAFSHAVFFQQFVICNEKMFARHLS